MTHMNHQNEAISFKSEIKAWLKRRGIDYSWLADQCGVSENTVRNWMAKAPIPPLKQRLIQKLISQQTGVGSTVGSIGIEPEVQIVFKMTTESYDQLAQAARLKGLDVGTLIRTAMRSLLENEQTTRTYVLPE